MLQHFSWGAFLIAVALISFLWYVFVALVFYRAELNAFFGCGLGSRSTGNSDKRKAQPSGKAAKDEDGRIELEVDAALMGTSRLPEGVEVQNSSQLSFSASDEDGRYEQLGLMADVMQELKVLFAELEKRAGDKKDFFRLLAVVKEEYGPLSGHPSVGALTGFIVERASFHLTVDEIENLWY